MLNQYFRMSLLVLISYFSIGCGTQVIKTDYESLKSVNLIAISEVKVIPEHLYYFGPERSKSGLLFGALGSAAHAGSAEEIGRNFDSYLESKQSKIEDIVMREVTKQINGSSFKNAQGGASDATMQITVEFYGLAGKNRLSEELKPTLRLRGQLIDLNGKLLWENVVHADPKDPSNTAVLVEELNNNPEKLIYLYQNASRLIIEQFITQISSQGNG